MVLHCLISLAVFHQSLLGKFGYTANVSKERKLKYSQKKDSVCMTLENKPMNQVEILQWYRLLPT